MNISRLLLCLSILVTLISCSKEEANLQYDVFYEIALKDKNFKVTASYKDPSKDKKSYEVPVIEKDNIILLSEKELASGAGDLLRGHRNPYNYTLSQKVKIELNYSLEYFSFSSFKSENGIYKVKDVSNFIIGLAKKDKYNSYVFQIENTDFNLISPRELANIYPKYWEESLKKIWPEYRLKFGESTDHLVFVDLNSKALASDALGQNVFAIFSQREISHADQKYIEINIGWKPQVSSLDYIEENYLNIERPWEKYLFETFSNLVSHLYFGFGVTSQRVSSKHELWFSLGLAMIYNMQITKKLSAHDAHLQQSLINNYLTKYSKKKELDRKLISPNTNEDKKFQIDRVQVFSKGKSAFFLSELRKKIGEKQFDQAVLEYLQCEKCNNGYDDFKEILKANKTEIEKLEQNFEVK